MDDKWVFVSLDDLDEAELSLRDYDIHTIYVAEKAYESDLSYMKKIDCAMFITSFRRLIMGGNFVKSNIRRVNYMVRNRILKEDEWFNVARREDWL